jgi:D-alanyl-D-alanine dipeptidase
MDRMEDMMQGILLRMLLCFLLVVTGSAVATEGLPAGFVYVEEVIPDIVLEIRYGSEDNFTGRRVEGYEQPSAILTEQAALALQHVAAELESFGLGLKIYDAYRPQRAVDDFVQWAKDPGEQRMKSRYYPHVDKAKLIEEGYIAERSGHSRGSTVDLSLISPGPEGPQELDMGTVWDYFGPESWPDSKTVTPDQRAHRMLLRLLMEKHGFVPLQQEWWHFTLRDEPFPDKYFDFPIR